jgi:protein arginine kinase
MTLGESELEIVDRINKVLLQIIEHEENARLTLLEKKAKVLFNHIGRAYGTLGNSHIISSKETMNQLSLLRLGVDLGMIPGTPKSLVDELFLLSQPAHLQLTTPDKLDAEQRDMLRADMLRDRMREVTRPDHSAVIIRTKDKA